MLNPVQVIVNVSVKKKNKKKVLNIKNTSKYLSQVKDDLICLGKKDEN